jgi:hypothetical protein
MRVGGPDQPLGLGDRVRDRLLDQDGDAEVEAVDRHRHVLVMRGAHVHHLGAYRFEQLAMVGEGGYAVSLRRGPGAGRIVVADPDQVDAGEVLDRLQMYGGHVPAPDYRGCCHELT